MEPISRPAEGPPSGVSRRPPSCSPRPVIPKAPVDYGNCPSSSPAAICPSSRPQATSLGCESGSILVEPGVNNGLGKYLDGRRNRNGNECSNDPQQRPADKNCNHRGNRRHIQRPADDLGYQQILLGQPKSDEERNGCDA